jgi:hypothetical protein
VCVGAANGAVWAVPTLRKKNHVLIVFSVHVARMLHVFGPGLGVHRGLRQARSTLHSGIERSRIPVQFSSCGMLPHSVCKRSCPLLFSA